MKSKFIEIDKTECHKEPDIIVFAEDSIESITIKGWDVVFVLTSGQKINTCLDYLAGKASDEVENLFSYFAHVRDSTCS